VQAPPMVAKLLTGLFLFCVGKSRGRKKKCAFLTEKNGTGMMIFIVADIWNCYNIEYE